MKEDILTWLADNDLDSCSEPALYKEEKFIDFLKELFPQKTEDQIKTQVQRCCSSTDNLDEFAECLSKWKLDISE